VGRKLKWAKKQLLVPLQKAEIFGHFMSARIAGVILILIAMDVGILNIA